MNQGSSRRATLKGLGIAAGLATLSVQRAEAAAEKPPLLPAGATALRDLGERLVKAPRRRDFKTVPMILNDPDQWDHEALSELIAYRAGLRQVWDNTDIASPWLNLMRNALNTQIWSFRHPEFLVVSATHGSAHLTLFDQLMWDKYQLANLAGGKFTRNTLLDEQPGASSDPTNYENAQGAFSPHDNAIPALQRRGVVFLSCHNAIWETGEKLLATGVNPDKLSHEAMAAELTNHLIPGAVLTPGAVGTLPELQQAGFHYAK